MADLLGGLQFAAKALEIWFAFVAASLVWAFASIMARGDDGIPLGHLLAYIESIDLLALISLGFWGSSRRLRGTEPRRRKASLRHWAFITFTVVMCVLCNIMGPAVAILVLPSLEYHETTYVPQQTFGQLLSTEPPTAFYGCTSGELDRSDYSCAYNLSGQLLDALAANNFASLDSWAFEYEDYTLWIPIASTPERGLQFSLNATLPQTNQTTSLLWTPLRQVVDDMYLIFTDLTNQSLANPTYIEALNSLELDLRRHAPAIGELSSAIIGNISTTVLDEDREIRCFWDPIDELVDCHKVGRGWKGSSSVYTFFVGSENSRDSLVQIDIWNSPKRGVFNITSTVFHEGNCLVNDTLPSNLVASCDYDSLFKAPVPDIVQEDEEFTDPNLHLYLETHVPNGPIPQARYLLETTFLLTNVTYSLDVSQTTNLNHQVDIVDLPPLGPGLTSVSMHPSWILAAWSVANGSTVPLNHTIGNYTFNAVQGMQAATLEDDRDFDYGDHYLDLLYWYYGLQMANMHAASWLTYNFTLFGNERGSGTGMPYDPDPSWESVQGQANATNPIVYSYFYRRVWMYGLQDRVTAYLGVIVAIIGMVVVLTRTLLNFFKRVEDVSLLELVVAALEYQPRGDFKGVKQREWHLSRVPFGLPRDHGEVGFESRRTVDDDFTSPRLQVP